MPSPLGRIVHSTATLSLFAGVLYSIVAPTYKFCEGIDRLTLFAQEAQYHIEGGMENYQAERFYGLFHQLEQKVNEREQAVIRDFRRRIESTLEINCHTNDEATYGMPIIKQKGSELYELRLACNSKELVISFSEKQVGLRERE